MNEGIAERTAASVEAAIDDSPLNDLSGAAGEKVGLVIVGGLAIGLLAAALMPRSKSRKMARRSRRISAMASELSQALIAQVGDAATEGRGKLDSLSRTISDTIGEHSKEISKQAHSLASDAADQLNDSGKAIARKAVKLIEKARR